MGTPRVSEVFITVIWETSIACTDVSWTARSTICDSQEHPENDLNFSAAKLRQRQKQTPS